mmetsp:Transcript_24913/g.64906  ORF Transcript_24913/g.64906 Transcript_24913/m.64906 type:complete len:425 (+) Transcript_24913:80-1354(+)
MEAAVLQQCWDFGTADRVWAVPATPPVAADGAPSEDETPAAGDVLSYPAAVVLLCGEGDFSFARSLVRAHTTAGTVCGAVGAAGGGPAKAAAPVVAADSPLFVCTSLDSEPTLHARYPQAADNMAAIREAGGVVLNEIDATTLPDCAAVGEIVQKGTRSGGRLVVIFNFPHHCGKGKIQVNRQLLHDFFGAAAAMILRHDDKRPGGRPSEVYVSLAPGQGGTDVDGPAQRGWGNSWQVVCRAAQAGLVCRGAFRFDAERWCAMGYAPRGRRFQGAGQFHVWRGVTHVFAPEQTGLHAVCSPTWRHDVGFWCHIAEGEGGGHGDDDPAATFFDEAVLVELVLQFVGSDLLAGNPERIRCEKQAELGLPPPTTDYEHRRAAYSHRLTYRVSYRASGERALSRERATALQLKLRTAMQKSGLPILLT